MKRVGARRGLAAEHYYCELRESAAKYWIVAAF